MAFQRKKRDQEQQLPLPVNSGQGSLFDSPGLEETDADNALAGSVANAAVGDAAPSLEVRRQQASKPGVDLGNIPLYPGNSATPQPIQRMPRVPLIQAKMTVGPAGDKYEQEADQVAAAVVKTINSPEGKAPVQREGHAEENGGAIQRTIGEEKEGHPVTIMGEAGNKDLFADQKEGQPETVMGEAGNEDLFADQKEGQPATVMGEAGNENLFPDQPEGKAATLMGEAGNEDLFPDQKEGQPVTIMGMETPEVKEDLEDEEKVDRKPTLQAKGESGGPLAANVESEISSAKGGGQALAPDLQERMGKAMGADFSGVRVHTDAQSNRLNESIQAKAFTTGQDVFFKPGEYQPGSRGGQELIAHELTHVLQQKRAEVDWSSEQQGGECEKRAKAPTEGRGAGTEAMMTVQRMPMPKANGGNKKRQLKEAKQAYEKWQKQQPNGTPNWEEYVKGLQGNGLNHLINAVANTTGKKGKKGKKGKRGRAQSQPQPRQLQPVNNWRWGNGVWKVPDDIQLDINSARDAGDWSVVDYGQMWVRGQMAQTVNVPVTVRNKRWERANGRGRTLLGLELHIHPNVNGKGRYQLKNPGVREQGRGTKINNGHWIWGGDRENIDRAACTLYRREMNSYAAAEKDQAD